MILTGEIIGSRGKYKETWNYATWERIQYWRKKLPWPYDRLVGTEYNSIHTNLSKNARKKLKK